MSDNTSIEWTDASWPVVSGCNRVSAGCDHCYAIRESNRLAGNPNPKVSAVYAGAVTRRNGRLDWSGTVRCLPERLDWPLKWRKPRRIFVGNMGDLFHERVSDEFIDRVFATMALAPRHTFQILTKRAKRMCEYCSAPGTPSRVAKEIDKLKVAQEISAMGEPRIEPIPEYPGYLVSDHGDVFSSQGSPICVRCGIEIPDGIARRRYCGKKCRDLDSYHRKKGYTINANKGSYRQMKPLPGEDGHMRVMFYRDREARRELVHRLVLTVFDRPPHDGEQGCHRNGDPTNNALPNLKWGDQSDNWKDRRRHGNARSHSKLSQEHVDRIRGLAIQGHSYEQIGKDFGISGTQVRNIARGHQWTTNNSLCWPLPSIWLGVSAEDQPTLDERVKYLLQTPATVRFVSLEPLLGPIDVDAAVWPCCIATREYREEHCDGGMFCDERALSWVIVGGESGPGARPIHPDWPRSIRDQCQGAGVPFFFKQWGAWLPDNQLDASTFVIQRGHPGAPSWAINKPVTHLSPGLHAFRVGKKAAGRELDGRTWDEMPEASSEPVDINRKIGDTCPTCGNCPNCGCEL